MTQPTSPFEVAPPSPRRLLVTTLIAAVGAAIVLVAVVLPAEYGIDPIGIGKATGLMALSSGASRTIEISDVIGGNETYRDVEIPEFGEPVPLPNPEVHQDQAEAFATRTMQIAIPPEQETEIKTVLAKGKMILYTWQVDRGDIYTDFHGHDPEAGNEYFVRYKEQQEGAGNNGSLVAPFAGEHGWYWLNYNDFPVVVTLTVAGYYDDIVDYDIF